MCICLLLFSLFSSSSSYFIFILDFCDLYKIINFEFVVFFLIIENSVVLDAQLLRKSDKRAKISVLKLLK